MCQVDEEYSDQLEKRTAPTVFQKCVKCKDGTAVLIIRAGDAFCRCCFKEYFIHKFRAMLGKNRLIFPGEKVLLAISGGPASSSMLSQVQEGLSQDAPKKLRFIPGIIYIDEGGVCGMSLEERDRSIAQLESIFRATGYPFHIVRLEQVFDLPTSVLEAVPPAPQRPESGYKAAVDQFIQNDRARGSCSPGEGGGERAGERDPAVWDAQVGLSRLETRDAPDGTPPPVVRHGEDLERLFSSMRTLTAKEDMLQTLRHHLLVHTARTQGYTKVMMGDSCSRLAVKLLSNIAQGRGATLATDTGFSDPRHGDVIIVRPMRDYSSKEIAFYNKMFGVPSVFVPGLDTKASDKASIQLLTESFVTKLQADFPSTVSTIYRTSEKLRAARPSQNAGSETSAKCLLCVCAVDTKAEEASAFHATLVSERLSQKRVPGGALPGTSARDDAAGQCCSSSGGGGCGAGGGGCCSPNRTPTTTDLKSLLCYSCRLTVKDMTAVDFLPRYIVSEAERRSRRSRMKQEISEFLLDEEEDEETC
ncbi:cytoplasmic tRNA 2-thiolation protein 2 [Anguilla anguilla]|uniref:cytoplasmic tRNA 2-thiolation protein 2 n=1 Tax=Anguilla anguilla TaxID=7936 RepID=UPI0015A961FC|nr:cytoplasmic tRNA 2-thiolation protein 2 [Anguilla anguilla]